MEKEEGTESEFLESIGDDIDDFLKSIEKLSINDATSRYRTFYATNTAKFIGTTRKGAVYIKDLASFFKILPKKIKEDVKHSTGITSFLKGVLAKNPTLFEIIKLETDNSVVFPSDAMEIEKDSDLALGIKIHDYIERDVIVGFGCYSPIMQDIEPSKIIEPPKQIRAFTEWMTKELGYTLLTSEFPIWLAIDTVYQISYVDGKNGPELEKKGKPPVANERWLLGKIDLLAQDKEGKLILVDFKTSRSGKVYYRDVMQIRLLALCLASCGIWVDGLVAIVIDTSEKDKELKASRYRLNMDQKAFKEMMLTSLPSNVNPEKYWDVLKDKVDILSKRIDPKGKEEAKEI
jgi:hypothetical protein